MATSTGTQRDAFSGYGGTSPGVCLRDTRKHTGYSLTWWPVEFLQRRYWR